MAWTIDYSETAAKQLRKLDRQAAKRVLDFMDARVAGSGDPRGIGKALTGPLLGAYWRYRVGDYRIICAIRDDILSVLVVEIGDRKEIYG